MKYRFSKFTQIYTQKKGCLLFHAINQEIFIGRQWLSEQFLQNRNRIFNINDFKDSSLFDLLLEKKLLVPADQDESIFDYVENVHSRPRRSYTLLRILLTDLCNLQCKYCKVEKNIKYTTSKATPNERLEKVVKIFLEGSKRFMPKVIHITGGEPLLFWHDVKKIIKFIETKQRSNENLFIVIGTNAILLNDEKVDFIKKHNIKVIVSIDGREKHHDKLRVFGKNRGSYNIVDKGIKKLKDAGVEVGLSMVIGKHNVEDLDNIISYFIKEYNPASLGVNFMKAPTKNEKKFSFMISAHKYVESIYSVFKRYRNYGLFMELPYRRLKPIIEKQFRYFDCGAAAGTTININAKGNIGPCKSFLIMEKVYSDKLRKDKIDKFLKTFRDRAPINKAECQNCPAVAICGNGCAYSSYVDQGDYVSIDKSACNYSKYFHKLILSDLFELNKDKIKGVRGYYLIKHQDRNLLLGKININQMTLASSIGHET